MTAAAATAPGPTIRSRLARLTPAALAALAALAAACGGTNAALRPAAGHTELILAYDDGRPSGTMAFPSTTYESVIRFDLPDGPHQPLRLRLQAGSAGGIAVTLYDNAAMDMPGQPLFSFTRDLGGADLSNGRDGRWLTADLAALRPVAGTVWVGVRKTIGDPTILTSSVATDQTYVRDSDPARAMGLLPVRRTPMVRLELAP